MIVSYIVHLPRWKSIFSSKYREEVMRPEVVSNITKYNYPKVCLQE